MTSPDQLAENSIQESGRGKIKITAQLVQRAAKELEEHPEFAHMTLEQIAIYYQRVDAAEDREELKKIYAVPKSGLFKRSVGRR